MTNERTKTITMKIKMNITVTETETETETENVPDIPDKLGNSNHYIEVYRLTVK